MQAEERRSGIAALLKSDKRVFVSELRRTYGVSEETIRRDLEKLEADGIARRTYGGALLSEDEKTETPYDIRRRSNVEEKYAIARLASMLIEDGEYLMMDESSTSFFVAGELKGRKDLTVITNSMEIVNEIAACPGWTVLCTGGQKRMSAPSFAGHQAESMVRSYHVDKAIISCGALDIEAGYTDRHEDTALIKRAMMASARQVILVADHAKFDRVAFATIGDISRLSCIVTDVKPDARWQEACDKYGVKLLYARGRNEE